MRIGTTSAKLRVNTYYWGTWHVLSHYTAYAQGCVWSQHTGHEPVTEKNLLPQGKKGTGEQVLQSLKWKFICSDQGNVISIAIQSNFSPCFFSIELLICEMPWGIYLQPLPQAFLCQGKCICMIMAQELRCVTDQKSLLSLPGRLLSLPSLPAPSHEVFLQPHKFT